MRTVRKMEEPLSATPGCEDVRCGCGSLLARFVDGAVELKCRRCKSVWRLPVEGDAPVSGAGAGRSRGRARAPGDPRS